jgi:hypothetical protein
MVKDNDKIASVQGSIGLREHPDSSRAGERAVGEPVSQTVLSQKRNMALSRLMRLQMAESSHRQYANCQMRIAASGCNAPDVTWISHYCIGAS